MKNETQTLPRKTTRPGVIPNEKKLLVPGSGRNRPAKGYNQATRQWEK